MSGFVRSVRVALASLGTLQPGAHRMTEAAPFPKEFVALVRREAGSDDLLLAIPVYAAKLQKHLCRLEDFPPRPGDFGRVDVRQACAFLQALCAEEAAPEPPELLALSRMCMGITDRTRAPRLDEAMGRVPVKRTQAYLRAIRELGLNPDISNNALAAKAGVSRRTVRRWKKVNDRGELTQGHHKNLPVGSEEAA